MHVKRTNPKTVQDVLQSLNEYSKEYGLAIQEEESTGKAEELKKSEEPATMTSKIKEQMEKLFSMVNNLSEKVEHTQKNIPMIPRPTAQSCMIVFPSAKSPSPRRQTFVTQNELKGVTEQLKNMQILMMENMENQQEVFRRQGKFQRRPGYSTNSYRQSRPRFQQRPRENFNFQGYRSFNRSNSQRRTQDDRSGDRF